ncbi:hypothetical protein IVB18_26165 [Bradyrhizobium sp. 186]|uniref:hypothetical protein n=1 Tax=Bradyrhizobium sp. 186 TaxID=2782654 RepID=UPI0020008E98|nr:hypothetical protein [Bradyrhizobium sp. 186]UPK31817.1 hypothetical protein IVB18_26165 [Bradyrhizobium sp. 186]
MDTIADYTAWKAKQQQNGVEAANTVLSSVEGSPDEVAGDLNLATEFGKVTGNPVPPAPMVSEYRPVFQQAIEREKNRTILSSAPRLTEWLRNPENAAVARDDLSGLSWWETAIGAGQNAFSRGVQRVPQSYNQFLANSAAERAQDQMRGFTDILSDQTAIRGANGDVIANKPIAGPQDLMAAGSRFLTSRLAGLIGIDDQQAAAYYQQQVGLINKRIGEIPLSPAGSEGRDYWNEAAKTNDFGTFMRVIAQHPGPFMAFVGETAAESLPSMAAAIGVGVVTRSPAAGATFMGVNSAITEKGSTPADFFREKGIDISTPEGAAKAVGDPALMREAIKRGDARGLVVGLMDGLSGGVAGKTLVQSHVGNMILQSITQAFMGAAGEAGGQIAAGQPISLGDILMEGFAEFAGAPVEVAGMGGGRLMESARKVKEAGERRALFEALSGQAQSSILRNRMPDKFRQFVEAATANGPVENVYVPADQFVQYFQGIGVDPHALVDELDGVSRDDLDAAIAGGGDLQIPTATYAAKIAGSQHDAFLMDNMRFDPDQFTAVEAQQFNERAQEAMQEAHDVAERVRVEGEQLRSFEQEIYDTMVSRLRAAGRSTDVATTEAMLYPAFYRVMAERSGLTTEEFMQRYPLPQVAGDIPEGIQYKTADDLNRTLAEARSRKAVKDTRQTLLEFIDQHGGINDVGGELKARNAETVSRGKGKKSLKLARKGVLAGARDLLGGVAGSGKKHGADDVAQAAIEAGFLADDPAVDEYKAALAEGREVPDIVRPFMAAIDRELRGEPQYSATEQADPAVARAGELDDIEAYLSSLGVTLQDDDATIRQAIDGAKQYAQAGPRRLFQSGGPGPRGAIQFPAAGVGNGDTVIRLFQTADLSTMLHESGHYFLTVIQDMAARGEDGATADYATVKEWWGANAADVAADAKRVMPDVAVTADDVKAALANGTTGDVMKDAAIDVGMQEQWARAFEGYLMDGKAPSADLRSAFEKFRAWLISVYRRLTSLNVTVSDDIRGVFDRMIASDDEIAKATAETGDAGPVFATAESMGLTDEQYAGFLKLRDQAQEDAKARLLRETMAPIKRQQEKWFKEERKAARADVEREVNAFPMYRALEWMGNRRWLGEGQPEEMPDIRLSKDALVERYGEGVLKTLPRGKQTVYTVEGGLDPDEAAGWFGFRSGDEMVRSLEAATPRKQAIDAETDRVMRDRHGDALNDGEIEAHALDAIHGPDKRGMWIAAELKAVVDVAGTGKAMTMKEARATARQTIGRMRVRDAMNANRFLAAERKAADEAARLGATLAREKIWLDNARRKIGTAARAAVRGEGSVDAVNAAIDANNAKFETSIASYTVPDREVVGKDGQAKTVKGGQRTATSHGYNDLVAKLIDAKRRQLLNHAFYSEARKVGDEVEKAERFVDKLGKASHRERIAGAGRRDNAQVDYLSAIDELLERYDFRQMSGAAEQRRGSLNAFVAAMTAAGRENELAIPENVLADAIRKPYKTLPVEELRGVVDSLKNLEHIALRWDKLIDAQREREFSATAEGIASAIDKNLPKRPPGAVKTKGEQARNTARAYLDSVLNATTLLRAIDGFADQGAAYQGIKAPLDEAQNRLIVRKQDAAKALEGLYAVYTKEERRAMSVRTVMPELGISISKWEKIALALNTGNEGNLSRLTDPRARRPFTMDQVSAVLASLDARDADFVQSVWDYIGTFKGDIAARERRATGVEPAWVDASPVTIGGKQLGGGYYPIKYDTRLSSTAADRETVDIAQSLAAGRFGKAQTRNGHLKERAAGGDGSIDLDIGVMHKHVNQVIYDLEMSEPVANAWRLIQDGRVRSALDDAGRSADFDALQAWLKDAAEGELGATSPVGAVLRGLKSNFTAAKLAFNISNALLQVTGVAQSFVVVGKKDMAIGIMKAARNPAAAASAVAAKSPFMASRQTTFNKDVMDFLEDSAAGATASRIKEFKKTIWGPASFWLMQKVQWHFADVPTWIAGYEQGLRKFGNDEAQAVAHADGLVKRAQASGLFIDRAGVERGSLSSRNRQYDIVKLFTTLGSYMFAKFNVAYERTAVASRTVRDEGVSVKSAQEVASWTLDMTLLFVLEALVGAAIKGQLPGQGDGGDDESWLAWLAKNTAFSVLGTLPFIRDGVSALQGHGGGGAYGSIVEELSKPAKEAAHGEVNKALVKSIVNAAGTVTGFPSVAANRVVDAGWRQSEGEAVSPLEFVFGKFKK